MKLYLIVSKGRHRGMPIPIGIDLFVIGSGKACQLRARHAGLAPQHTALTLRQPKAFIRDLGSGFGTYVNGEEVPTSEEWPLHKGDTISMGPLEFRISFSETALNQRDLEEWALRTLDTDTGPKKSAMQELDEIDHKVHEHHHDAASAAGAIMAKMSALKGVVRGRLRIMRDGAVTIVKLNDDSLVDEAELVHLKKELHENLDLPNQQVLLDMKNVRRMSSAAVLLLAELKTWLGLRASKLAVCRLRPELKSLVDDMRDFFQVRVFAENEDAMSRRW